MTTPKSLLDMGCGRAADSRRKRPGGGLRTFRRGYRIARLDSERPTIGSAGAADGADAAAAADPADSVFGVEAGVWKRSASAATSTGREVTASGTAPGSRR